MDNNNNPTDNWQPKQIPKDKSNNNIYPLLTKIIYVIAAFVIVCVFCMYLRYKRKHKNSKEDPDLSSFQDAPLIPSEDGKRP